MNHHAIIKPSTLNELIEVHQKQSEEIKLLKHENALLKEQISHQDRVEADQSRIILSLRERLKEIPNICKDLISAEVKSQAESINDANISQNDCRTILKLALDLLPELLRVKNLYNVPERSLSIILYNALVSTYKKSN